MRGTSVLSESKEHKTRYSETRGKEKLVDEMFQIFCKGKQALDASLLETGRMVAETIMYVEREEIGG